MAPATGLINPQAIVFNAVTGKVNGLVIVDDQFGTPLNVSVGVSPVSLAVDSSTDTVYLVNAGDGTVSILSGTSSTVVATIPIGAHLYSIAIDANAGRVYVTHTFSVLACTVS